MNYEIKLTELDKSILKIFDEGFKSIWSHMDKKYQAELIDKAQLVFEKWYCSPLLPETAFTPSLLHSVNDNKTDPEGCVSALILKTDSRDYEKEPFGFKKYIYSADNHPVIYDLKKFADFCSPTARVDERGFLYAADAAELQRALSLDNGFYLRYITLIAYRVGIAEKMSSIHSNNIKLSDKAEKFFAEDKRLALREVINQSVDLCAEKINDLLAFEGFDVFISADIIKDFLEKPVPTQEIFEEIFLAVGFDVDKMLADMNDDYEFESALTSTAFFIGVTTDNWFYTVFGAYLRLIEPIYGYSFDFKDLINGLCEFIIMQRDCRRITFSPCTACALTPLGMDIILGEKYEEEANVDMDLCRDELIMVYKEALFNIRQKEIAEELLFDYNMNFYRLKLAFEENEEYNKELEVCEDESLENFGVEIMNFFDIPDSYSYGFIINDKNGFPIEYVSRLNKKPSFFKADEYNIGNFGFKEGDTFKFNIRENKSLNILITVLHKAKISPYSVYPKIVGQSRLACEQEKDFYEG